MKNFDDEYYIIMNNHQDDNCLYLKADKKTANRGYHYKKVPLGEAPFFFENSYREEDLENGVQRPITEMFEVACSLLVNDAIREELMKYDIEGMQLYPSVYMDDQGNWHENYWFLNFYEKYDYWDRERSMLEEFDDDYDDEDEDDYDDEDVEIAKYALDAEKLSAIPEDKRLLFQIGGGVNKIYTFAHQRFVDFVTQNNFKGVRFFKVSEFEEGDQF